MHLAGFLRFGRFMPIYGYFGTFLSVICRNCVIAHNDTHAKPPVKTREAKNQPIKL
jgi:hypothetical protein